jgi:predicted DsbA family dithiol-disulfide isomerase
MRSELIIAVCFDLICPWCLIGRHHLQAAVAMMAESDPRVAVRVDWRSVQLLPQIPDEGLDFVEFYDRRLGGPEAVRARQRQVLGAASAAGCEIDFGRIRRMPNTARAHRLLQFARTSGDEVRFERLLDRLFAAHFVEGLDIGDAAVLEHLADGQGYPADAARARMNDTGRDGDWRHDAPSVPLFVAGGRAIAGAHPPQALQVLMRAAAEAIRAQA